MGTWTDDAAIEIEALQATYGHELDINEQLQQVSMLLLPHGTSPDGQQHFVQCQLLLTLPEGYPSTAPVMQLQDVRGFALRRGCLLQQLQADAAELAGELLLGHLFESAKAWLTEHNHPEGPCIFCLEDLVAAGAAGNTNSSSCGHNAAPAAVQHKLMRLPCFHAFHETCFASWWCWQQQAYMDQQKALEAKTGATAAAALVQEALPPKDGPLHFQLSCPTCRAPFQLAQLQQHFQQQLSGQLSHQQQQQQQQLQQSRSGSNGNQQQQQQRSEEATKLTAAQLQPFKELQQQFAALFLQQQRRQGIIDTDVSYCIADWQQPPAGSNMAAAAAGPERGGPGAAAAAAHGRNNNSAAGGSFGGGPPRAGRSTHNSSSGARGHTGASSGRGRGHRGHGSRGSASRSRGRGRHSEARQHAE